MHRNDRLRTLLASRTIMATPRSTVALLSLSLFLLPLVVRAIPTSAFSDIGTSSSARLLWEGLPSARFFDRAVDGLFGSLEDHNNKKLKERGFPVQNKQNDALAKKNEQDELLKKFKEDTAKTKKRQAEDKRKRKLLTEKAKLKELKKDLEKERKRLEKLELERKAAAEKKKKQQLRKKKRAEEKRKKLEEEKRKKAAEAAALKKKKRIQQRKKEAAEKKRKAFKKKVAAIRKKAQQDAIAKLKAQGWSKKTNDGKKKESEKDKKKEDKKKKTNKKKKVSAPRYVEEDKNTKVKVTKSSKGIAKSKSTNRPNSLYTALYKKRSGPPPNLSN